MYMETIKLFCKKLLTAMFVSGCVAVVILSLIIAGIMIFGGEKEGVSNAFRAMSAIGWLTTVILSIYELIDLDEHKHFYRAKFISMVLTWFIACFVIGHYGLNITENYAVACGCGMFMFLAAALILALLYLLVSGIVNFVTSKKVRENVKKHLIKAFLTGGTIIGILAVLVLAWIILSSILAD